MVISTDGVTGEKDLQRRERTLWVLCAAAALIFLQAHMVAPLLPRFSEVFQVPEQRIGLIVPAYMIAYGLSTLFYGILSDWIRRARVINFSLLAFVLLTALTATAQSSDQMILWRLLTGLGASGVVPVSLAMIGDLYPFERRGKPLGMLFAAMEGGMALGSTAGVMLDDFIGLSRCPGKRENNEMQVWKELAFKPIFSKNIPCRGFFTYSSLRREELSVPPML